MSYILGHSTSELYNDTTAHRLSELLQIKFINSLSKIRGGDILVRYGISKYPGKDGHFVTVLNNSWSIMNSANKYRSLVILKEHRVPVPKVYLSHQLSKECLPVLRRLNYHTRGRDIVKIIKITNIKPGDFYTELIDGDVEFRIHVFNGEVIRIQKKVDTTPDSPRRYIRSFENGYMLRDSFKEAPELLDECAKVSIKAVEVLELNFGAVDVIVSNDGDLIVLEVNTSPRLNKYGRQLYTLYIADAIGKDIDMAQLSRVRDNNTTSKYQPQYRDIVKE